MESQQDTIEQFIQQRKEAEDSKASMVKKRQKKPIVEVAKNRNPAYLPTMVRANKKSTSLIAPVLSYKGQPHYEVWLPATPFLLATVVATGIQTTYSVNVSNISAFAARFAGTFVEYRIVKAKFVVRCFSTTTPGLLLTWFDEKDFAAPTLGEALEKSDRAFSLSNFNPHVETWTATDPLDLQYTDTSLAVTPVGFKVFTNVANFGSPAVSTNVGEIYPHFLVQFRGLF